MDLERVVGKDESAGSGHHTLAPKVRRGNSGNAFDSNMKIVDLRYISTKVSASNDIEELDALPEEYAALLVFLHVDRDLIEDRLAVVQE
jgi:hypothetical protein